MREVSMNSSMGTQPLISTDNNGHHNVGNHNSLSQDAIHGVLTSQGQYGSGYSQVNSGYSPFNIYDKVGMMHSMTKESVAGGNMFEPHSGIYSNHHTSRLQTADSRNMSPPLPPRIYKPCVVCNDKSSGYHYGVSSCEGCKGFFRRSVQKNMQYQCHKDKNCVINKVTRNRCQYCRLQKCVTMGMSKEAVRNDRHKKKKQKPESTLTSSEELTEDDQMILQEVLEAHRGTTPNSQNGVNLQLSKAAKAAMGNSTTGATTSLSTSTSESRTDDDWSGSSGVILWEKITELSSAGIVLIVDFAKKIPGFLSLPTSDQITLLKAACLEIMILRISIRYDMDTDTMQFPSGLALTREKLQKGGFGPLTSTIFSFAKSLKRMNCDETEYAILSSICLISGDRSGLIDIDKIEQMQEPILEALKHYIRSRRPDERHMFAKLLMKLTDLRSISVKGAECLQLRLEKFAPVPPLMAEMLHRAENVSIPIPI